MTDEKLKELKELIIKYTTHREIYDHESDIYFDGFNGASVLILEKLEELESDA